MKFLESPSLAYLTSRLTGIQSMSGDRIYARIENYSCRHAGSDKKLARSLEQQLQVELSRSPEALLSQSPFGPLTETASRNTLTSLLLCLNASFPDYDFSDVRAEQFRKEAGINSVVNSINSALLGVTRSFDSNFGSQLWSVVDSEISLKECDIYSYIPDLDSDPYAEAGNVWSFNYFFYNKRLNRLLFFTCHCVSKMAMVDDEADDSFSADDDPTETGFFSMDT